MYRSLCVIGDRHYKKELITLTYKGWKSFLHFRKNIEQFVVERYIKGLKKKSFYAFNLNCSGAKDYKLQLEIEFRRKGCEEDALRRAIWAVNKIISYVRMKQAYKRVRSRRVEVLYATQVLQNFARTGKLSLPLLINISTIDISLYTLLSIP